MSVHGDDNSTSTLTATGAGKAGEGEGGVSEVVTGEREVAVGVLEETVTEFVHIGRTITGFHKDGSVSVRLFRSHVSPVRRCKARRGSDTHDSRVSQTTAVCGTQQVSSSPHRVSHSQVLGAETCPRED